MKSNFFDRPQYTSPFMSQTLSSCHESIKDIIIIIISAFGKKKKQPTILMIDEITIQTRGLKTFHYDVKLSVMTTEKRHRLCLYSSPTSLAFTTSRPPGRGFRGKHNDLRLNGTRGTGVTQTRKRILLVSIPKDGDQERDCDRFVQSWRKKRCFFVAGDCTYMNT